MSANAWMPTFTGRIFEPFNPDPDSICIDDIAHALAKLCRYGGRCGPFYSVAQHCVLMSHVVPPADRPAALMHDATEAYYIDLPRPLKRLFPLYTELEEKLYQVIADKYRLPAELPPSVKHADLVLLATEKRDLVTPHNREWQSIKGIAPLDYHIEPWDHEHAKRAFKQRAAELGVRD
jgi:5'-deoxynucleotidase YfbR-like HD superfamily hydrolase